MSDDKKPVRPSGTVKQQFARGKTVAVSVETKKKTGGLLNIKKPSISKPVVSKPKTAATIDSGALIGRKPEGVAATPSSKPAAVSEQARLSNAEREARAMALARAKEGQESKEEHARQLEEQRRAREEAQAAREAEELAREKVRRASEEAEERSNRIEETRSKNQKQTTSRAGGDPLSGGRIKSKKPEPAQPARQQPKKGNEQRRKGRLTIAEALAGDEERQRSIASVKRRREKEKAKSREALEAGQKIVREVIIPETITVAELANRMAERQADVIKSLMKMGMMVTAAQSIDADTAELVVDEFGHKFDRVSEADVVEGLFDVKEDEKNLASRPPIVTIMGHVDHGKTSILDHFRKSDVVSSEAGGITQHIGAYQITMPSGNKISFLDTPGHAAFTEMRARGANVTDLVIIVIAADDGIMPQTKEAINHAKASGAPIIIAINKCDTAGANPDKVEMDLLQENIQTENMGGEVQAVHISAKTGQNMNTLEEAINIQAELLELKADPSGVAKGNVVESRLETGRGVVSTLLIERGTLTKGEILVAGKAWGKVRALFDDRNQQLKEATPAQPVEILGLSEAPASGEPFVVVDTESRAREIVEFQLTKEKEAKAAKNSGRSLEDIFSNISADKASELAVILKSDVHGSVEAISTALEKLGNEEVKIRILHSGVGAITESDVVLAKASKALILGFNVRANPQARDAAKRENIDIRYHSIIYALIDEMRDVLSGMLEPERVEDFIGYAEILEVFNITKVGNIAGCKITDGIVKRNCGVRLLRDNIVIHEGTLKTLKRYKDEVAEVRNGYECGMAFENYEDLKVGDQIECFTVSFNSRKLDTE